MHKSKHPFHQATPTDEDKRPGASESATRPSRENLSPAGTKSKSKRGRKKSSGEQILSLNYYGKAFQFYHRCPWGKWWEEFSTATMPNGALRYPSAWAFAKAKAKNNLQEQRWIWDVIGPKPVLAKGRKKPAVPWLGDWLKRREGSFWFATEKTKALSRVLQERQNALEAARAVGALSVEWIRRFVGLANQVDDYFEGQMLLPELSLKENQRRSSLYLKLHEGLFRLCSKATEDYLRCHGIHQDDVTVLAQLTAVSTRAAIPADTNSEPGVDGWKLLQAQRFTQHLMSRAETFNMPLPDFGPWPEDGEKDEEFVKSFPVERFPALAGFFKKCFASKPFSEYLFPPTAVEDFCKNCKPEEIACLDREFADFLTFTSQTTHAAMQSVVTDRFGSRPPLHPCDWNRLRTWIAHYAQRYHGPDWRKAATVSPAQTRPLPG